MFLRKARRIGRVFALILLTWTAVDLLDRGACQNEHGLLVPRSSAEAPLLGGRSAPGEQHGDAFPPGHAGDCFCCSSFVDVKLPFALSIASAFVWVQPGPSPTYASVPLRHVFRPPIPLQG